MKTKILLSLALIATTSAVFANNPPCVPPALTGTIADQTATSSYSVNVSDKFAGTTLKYTLNIASRFQMGNPDRCASISSRGVITVNDAAITGCHDMKNTTVTASNACGTVTSNEFTMFA